MIIFLIVIAFIAILYICSTAGRTGHTGLPEIHKWSYAHRGLHGDGIPENSMEAFRRAKEAGYGIELDVHLLADGNLAVIHDAQMKRTTGSEGLIEDLTTGQLKDYHLQGTDETIPEFSQVLELFAGQAPLIVELKCVRNNYAALCKNVCNMLDHYDGPYCLESFDPRCIYWLRKHRPDLIRGQLTENYFASPMSKLPWVLKFALRHQVFNFLTRPDFIAYKYCDRKTISNTLCRKLWKLQCVSWTLKTQGEYDTAVSEGWIPIFEGFEP